MKMKWMSMMCAAALTGAGMSPVEARADSDEAAAAIVGLLGGLIIGAAVSDADHVTYVRSSRHHRRSRVQHTYARPSGYYTYKPVKVWVDGCWEYIETRRGDLRKVWKSGYYRTDYVKVWVSAERRRYCR